MPTAITSRKNDLVREFQRLSGSASIRREERRFTAEGARLCADAAESGIRVLALLYTEKADEKYAPYLAAVRRSSPSEYEISDSLAEYLSDTKSPQGVFCVCAMPEENDALPKPDFHLLMMENTQDPANLGAVLRTAEAFGIGGVVLAGSCCDAFSPKVLRASMGAVFRLPVFFRAAAPEAVRELNASGYATLAAVPDASAVPVTALDFHRPVVAVVGNEGNGLTPQAISACSARVTIPMKGRAESLNAAASAAVLMWEMTRGFSGGERA